MKHLPKVSTLLNRVSKNKYIQLFILMQSLLSLQIKRPTSVPTSTAFADMEVSLPGNNFSYTDGQSRVQCVDIVLNPKA